MDTNPQGVQSKIAQYIAGEVKLNDLISSNKLRVPVQKRFQFEDTWITMNKTIGEAVLQQRPTDLISVGQSSAVSGRSSWDKFKKATEIQQKRRNAIAVINQATREMTNGRSWPKMEDWLICPDQKIRYSQFIVPFRKPSEKEWLQKSVGGAIESSETPVETLKPEKLVDFAKPEVVVEKLETLDKPLVDVEKPQQKSEPKLESSKSIVTSSCPSNYNTPGCFGPLPHLDSDI